MVTSTNSSIVTIKCLAPEEQNRHYQSAEDGNGRNESYVIYLKSNLSPKITNCVRFR